MATTLPVSHALVLPDADFMSWYNAASAYTKTFDRVAVVRSPAGNDLNRFRNVSAVQAPGVWVNNDALSHIRRVYPMVVQVDVIQAATPAQLTTALQDRIRLNDRYGAKSSPTNLHSRFTLDWPSDARPASITRAFDDNSGGHKNEGLDIYAPQGTSIRASAAGTVATIICQSTSIGYGQYVQVSSTVEGQNYLTTYAHLQNIRVNLGQTVQVGDVLGESETSAIKVVVQQPGHGLSGYTLPDVVDPTMMIYWQGLRLKATDSGLRIRERAGTDFKVLAQLTTADRSETLEPHGRTLLKLGKADQWVKIRSPQGVEGFVSGQYLVADESSGVQALNMAGVNLDILHPLGKPGADRLKGLGWVRFAYNVSRGSGSTDLEAAYNLYAPYIEAYSKAGLKVILVLTHQTYGEGRGYIWPQMDSAKWRDLTAHYTDFIRQIAQRFAGKDQVTAYQIWNEQDTPPSVATAAVCMPSGDYAYLLTEAIKAIRTVDSKVNIITGGHVGGPGTGAAYARATLAAMPSNVRPDAIACHSYGRGMVGNKYSPFGSIDDDVDAYSKIIGGAQVWITEWGVLDHPSDPAGDVDAYATSFIHRLKTLYSGKVAAAVWYGWADGMHNGYGLVNPSDQPKQPLYDHYLHS